MADIQTWGMLPKAQDDPTTVDEAILAAISAHNDDPDAHLAAGQSIDVHRTNSIIDHPAGSVLADKASIGTRWLSTNFETLTGFTVSGLVTRFWPGVKIVAHTATATNAEITPVTTGFILAPFDFVFIPFVQAVVNMYTVGSDVSWFGLGSDPTVPGNTFFGIKFVGTTAYGVVRVDTNLQTVNLGTIDEFNHQWRAAIDPDTHDALFFLDGVLVGSIASASFWADASGWGQNDSLFSFGAHATTAGGVVLYVASFITGYNLPE